MRKAVLRRIFAWIALIAALCATVFLILFFFNIAGELSVLFGTITLVFVCVVAVFFILAKYVLADREEENVIGAEIEPEEDGGGEENEN